MNDRSPQSNYGGLCHKDLPIYVQSTNLYTYLVFMGVLLLPLRMDPAPGRGGIIAQEGSYQVQVMMIQITYSGLQCN
jgi:hypothetical protein